MSDTVKPANFSKSYDTSPKTTHAVCYYTCDDLHIFASDIIIINLYPHVSYFFMMVIYQQLWTVCKYAGRSCASVCEDIHSIHIAQQAIIICIICTDIHYVNNQVCHAGFKFKFKFKYFTSYKCMVHYTQLIQTYR